MPNGESDGVEQKGGKESLEPNSGSGPNCSPENASDPFHEADNGSGSTVGSRESHGDGAVPVQTVIIMISQPEESPIPKATVSKSASPEKDEKIGGAATAKKGCLSRSESYHEQCRVCQQQTEEPLMDLGCRCRGELAKAHRSCIEIWFRTKGSNKCEICQQVAMNVTLPESQQSTNYWIWRIDSAYGGIHGERERRCFSPIWVAFAILIGGLLLDVLISVSLGVSALPVNIIIGVLIVLGLGTALRIALECCHEWGTRRTIQRVDMPLSSGFHTAV